MIIKYCRISELDQGLLEEMNQYLPEAKKYQVRKYSSKQAYIQTLACWYLLKNCCEKNGLEYEPDKILFLRNGKPVVKNNHYYFSLAHSHDIAICVIDDHPIGIDIEKIREVDGRLIKHFSDEKRYKFINESDIEFWKMWCMLESCIKVENLTVFDIDDVDINIQDMTYRNGYFRIHSLLDDYMIITAHQNK